ncbi:MAG: Dyp-type peroxidase [Tolypothrix sp. T3-bin4]|nr:Dyp-type peroxidase [Tolypothrix sp. T3-bin4]
MPLDLELNFGPVDQDDAKYADVLEDLQGNILNGHGRDHATHIFIAFDKPDQIENIKKWIANLEITSAKVQLDGSERYKQEKIDAGLFTHFALSASGYARLGIPESQQPQGANPQNREAQLYANAFQEGMENRQSVLLDPPSSQWEPGFQSSIDAVLILANDDAAELTAEEIQILEQLKDIATLRTIERGLTLRRKFETVDMTNPSNEFGVVVEHFGYADGVSQPLFLKKQYEQEKGLKKTRFWDPMAPLKLVLIPDPNGKTVGVSFGSFLVFRKLEQNVQGFKTAEAKLGESLGLSRELAGAMAVGRYRDGSPLVLQPGDGAWANSTKPAIPNDFNYQDDKLGLACPFHAHIRKSNPRSESVKAGELPFAQSKEEELGHRIARRGITYGGPLSSSDNLRDLPRQGVGLLFICYQSDIWEQFEFIQRFWCNNPNSFEPDFSGGANSNYDKTGLDPVIGQKQGEQIDPVIGEAPNPPKNWPSQWGKSTVKPEIPQANQFGQFVTLKGGEYFFSPSISFLKNLPS